MGSDESHFNVSLIVTDKVTRQCPQTTTLEVKGEQKQIRTEVPLLTSLTARETAWGVGVPEVMRQRQGGKVEARQTSFLSQTHR